MTDLIGQLLFTGIRGHSLTSEEKKFIGENNIGGVILFARNIADPRQVRDLCTEIQSLRHQQSDRAHLFIGIDQEGGRVTRLKAPFTVWPPAARLGEVDNSTVSFHFANRMGREMRAVGINLDFAPCVDVLTNPRNTAIGDRAISSDPTLVEKHTSAIVRGYIKAGLLTCAKHFPGHGNTIIDSHDDLPVEAKDLQQLDKIEFVPFKKAFRSRVDMTMVAHLRYPQIDPQWPTSLSSIFMQDILRNQLRFRGLIVTDDLGMGALVKHFSRKEIAVRTLEAGCDLLLYCNEFDAPPAAIEAITSAIANGRLKKSDLESRKKRILALKKEKLENPDPLPLEQALAEIGTPENLRISASLAMGETPSGLLPE